MASCKYLGRAFGEEPPLHIASILTIAFLALSAGCVAGSVWLISFAWAYKDFSTLEEMLLALLGWLFAIVLATYSWLFYRASVKYGQLVVHRLKNSI